MGHLVPFFFNKILIYSLHRSIKLMIISQTFKFGSRKCRINVKNTCFYNCRTEHFGVLSIIPCATAVNDILGALCSTLCSIMWTRNFFVSLLSSIDYNVRTISCPMLRPLSVFSLVCRFNHQFSQHYINKDTDEIQH